MYKLIKWASLRKSVSIVQGDQMNRKFIFQEAAKTVDKPKNAQKSTQKLILKVQNIYIKPLLNLKIPATNHVLKLPISVKM